MPSRQLAALLAARDPAPGTGIAGWNELATLAVRERVAPSLARVIADDESVPETARERLAGELYRTAAFNLLLFRELGRVLRFDRAAPSPVVLKGAALATTVYEDVALRPMSDLDLLVHREHLPAWEDRLIRLGYEPVGPAMTTGLSEIHYQLAFRGGPHREVVIELHWNLVAGEGDWRAPDIAWFWRQTAPWPGIEDAACPPALQLNPLASLLYSSAHALLQHGGARTRLVWLLDIHRIVERNPGRISWPRAIDLARAFRWDAALGEALDRCRELFGTPVDDSVVSELRREASMSARTHVRDKASVEQSRAELVWRELSCLNAKSRRRLVQSILFPMPAYVKWRYPRAGALWPLAYVYRWGVVAREAATCCYRMLTRVFSFVFL